MTVTAGSYEVKRYNYSGAGSYAFTFKVYEDTDLSVQYIDTDGVTSTLVMNTDYTVTLVDGVDGGTCVASYAPTTGTLVLSRDLPIDQETDFVNNDSFDMEILEDTIDKTVLILQQIESVINGSLVAVNWAGDWATGVAYEVNEIAVAADGSWYKCAFDHTAGVFATDLASGYWIMALDLAAMEANVAATAADRVQTALDVIATAADVVSTNADAAATAQDAIDTAADVVLTNADVTYSAEWANKAEDSLISVAAGGDGVDDYSALHSAAKAAADLVLTNADVVLTHADVVLTNADVATLANKIERTSATGSAVMPKGTEAQRDGSPLSGYMRFNTDEGTFEGHDGSEWGAIGGGGGGLTWSVVTADTTAEDANGYIIDTSTGTKTLTLPATPTVGMTVGYKDLNGYFGTAPLVIDGNGANIQGLSEDLTVNSNNAGGSLVYSDATEGWVLTSSTPLQTIQSKPLLHVQDQKASGTSGGTSASTDHDRDLNTILTNEIAGSSLSSNEITLPAGEYYIEASSSFSANITGNGLSRLFIRKSDDTTLLVGDNTTSYYSATPTVSGKITLTVSTVIKLVMYHNKTEANGLGIAQSRSTYEVYSDLKIWRLDMDKVYPNLSDPSIALSKPLMHVQDQKPTGTAGGSCVVGDNDRDLNVVLTNEISGASLSSNEVTLAAGTYYIEGISVIGHSGITGVSNRNYIKDAADNKLLVGTTVRPWSADGTVVSSEVSGNIVLTETTTIKLSQYTNDAFLTEGLGVVTNQAPYEVYADLKIWQIDAVTQTLITRQPINQPITGAYTTGDIFGGELEYVDATTFNVKAVSTYSDDLTTALFINATTLVDLGAPAINTIYNAFLVKNSDLSYDVLTDTDVNGAGLPGTVSYKRWLGFVLTDSSGDIIPFDMAGNELTFTTGTVILGTIIAAQTRHDISSFVPISRVESVIVGTQTLTSGTTSNVALFYDNDGAEGATADSGNISAGGYDCLNMEFTGAWFRSEGTASGITVKLQTVRLKR